MSLIFTVSKMIKIRNPATMVCSGESFTYCSVGGFEEKRIWNENVLRSAINTMKSLSCGKLYVKFS